jgi:hypothetical protein
LRHKKAVPRNTHSVTLVPYIDGIRFIFEKIRERQKIEKQNQVALEILSKKPVSAPVVEAPLPVPSVPVNPIRLQQVSMLNQYSSTPSSDHWRTPRNHLSAPPPALFPPRASYHQTQGAPVHYALPRQFPPVNYSRPQQGIPSSLHHSEYSTENSFASLLSLANLSEIEAQKLDEERKMKSTVDDSDRLTETKGPQNPGWLDLLMNAAPSPIIQAPPTPSLA